MLYRDYIKEKLHVDDDESIVERAVDYLAGYYPQKNNELKEYKIVDERIQQIATKWKVNFHWAHMSNLKFGGKLVPQQGGFIAFINKNLSLPKRRFVAAHELGHILSHSTTGKRPKYEVRHGQFEEDTCDKIAWALLLPKSLIDLSDLSGISSEELASIGKRFKVPSASKDRFKPFEL